jgi:hypothetical protein
MAILEMVLRENMEMLLVEMMMMLKKIFQELEEDLYHYENVLV